jgi:hypothetical protein
MATNPTKPFRMAPVQRLTVKPIVDPAEQAALDERLKHAQETDAEVPTPQSGSRARTRRQGPNGATSV